MTTTALMMAALACGEAPSVAGPDFEDSFTGDASGDDRGPEIDETDETDFSEGLRDDPNGDGWDEEQPAAPIFNGLSARQESEIPHDAHPTEIIHMGDSVIVANSNSGVAVYGLRERGLMPVVFGEDGSRPMGPRCTTIALHEPSSTLYCGTDPSAQVQAVAAIDVSTPRRPEIRRSRALPDLELPVADLHVEGEELFLARFQRGLWVSAIDSEGELSEPVDLGIEGNVRGVSPGPDGTLFVLTADRGLLLIEEAGESWVELADLALPGPSLRMTSDGARALVALGSEGAVLVAVEGDDLVLRQRFTQTAVITAVALRAEAAFLAGAGGYFLYDLRAEEPRLAGYGDEVTLPIDAFFHDDQIYVSDWGRLTRAYYDLDGVPVGIQARRGMYLREGEPVSLVVRNPGVLDVRFTIIEGETEYELPAGGSVRIDLSGDEVAELGRGFYYRWVTDEGIWGNRIQHMTSRREPEEPALPPPTGGRFPEVTVVDLQGRLQPAVPEGERVRLAFFSVDCAAMWPLLQDAAWLEARGELDDGAILQLMPLGGGQSFLEHWLDDDVRVREPGPAEANPGFMRPGDTVFDFSDAFRMPLGDLQCTDPTDYLVGVDGIVEAAEREYFGRYHFR